MLDPLYPVIIVIINNLLQSNAMYKLTNGLDVIQLLKDDDVTPNIKGVAIHSAVLFVIVMILKLIGLGAVRKFKF